MRCLSQLDTVLYARKVDGLESLQSASISQLLKKLLEIEIISTFTSWKYLSHNKIFNGQIIIRGSWVLLVEGIGPAD